MTLPTSDCPCEQFPGRLKDLCLGVGLDGRPNPQAKHVAAFREQHGFAPLPARTNAATPVADQKAWDVSQPSRGLGDVIAKVTHATGIDKVVKAVAGKKGCGCAKRQAALNAAVPFAEQA